MGDEAYKKVLDELRKARAEQDPLRTRMRAVMAARDFLTAHKVPDELTRPLNKVITALYDSVLLKEHGNKPGPKRKPIEELVKIGIAAAIVTALRACDWRVQDAINEVCKVTKIDRKRLRQIRDNLHRGIGDPITYANYTGALDDLLQLPQDRLESEALLRLEALPDFL